MKRASFLALTALLAACGGNTTGTDAGGRADSGAPSTDSGAPGSDAGPAFLALHGCEEADYVDRTAGSPDSRMVMVPPGTFEFDFPCMTIRAGQDVMFMWDFADHPLRSGIAPGETGVGTEPSPIEPQDTGSLYTETFSTPGFYPYFCEAHSDLAMFGVIRVVP